MRWQRPVSRGLFFIGLLLLAGSVALLVAARTAPAEGLQDLARVVGAMLVAGAAGVAFALSLLLGRGTEMPRWMVIVAALGCAVALLPGGALLWASVTGGGATGGLLFGLLFLAAGAVGLASAPRLLRHPARG